MKETQRLNGIHLSKPYGGHISCEECGQILGYLSPMEEIRIYLNIRCRCGNSGYLLRGIIPQPEDQEPLADRQESVSICPICRRKLFSVTERTRSYGFRIQCTCGYHFDKTYLRQREVYPVRNLPELCLHKTDEKEKADKS